MEDQPPIKPYRHELSAVSDCTRSVYENPAKPQYGAAYTYIITYLVLYCKCFLRFCRHFIAIQENSSIKISRENFTVQGKRPQLGCRPAREFDAAMWDFIRKICVGIFLDCYSLNSPAVFVDNFPQWWYNSVILFLTAKET